MCKVCGCGTGEVRVGPALAGSGEGGHHHDHHHGHDHHHEHGHDHGHGHHQDHHHDHHHAHGEDGVFDYATGPVGAHVPGLSPARMVEIEQNILSANDAYAAGNRARLDARSVLALNLVSSPGAGKTSLLVRTVETLKADMPVSVIEGDQETSNDAARIRATGVTAVQINTGRGCHLDAHMVGHALDHIDPAPGSVVFIENVGNLVCPAGFDLGEAAKVVALSVTEGDDKPLKYPDMFAASSLMLVTKTDLLAHVDFDVDTCIANARKVNPEIAVICLSAKTGEGMAQWLDWIGTQRRAVHERRVAALEAQLAEAKARLGA